ncbi:unnamed protein product [Pocillopora meandrina]|uniref:Uncharacterized protein n=1 Tax=Pocillopora meandrina TaxID=46732 RepID=A0AAU9XDJ8_9CNID|nr:unnamed protein product [Pocillopora meandrina]
MSLKQMLSAKLVAHVSLYTSFEVMVNGKLIFSKLEQGSFPSFKEIVVVVHDCSQGKEPCEVTEKEESSCILL